MGRDTVADKIGDRGREQLAWRGEKWKRATSKRVFILRDSPGSFRRTERIHFCPGQKHSSPSWKKRFRGSRPLRSCFFERPNHAPALLGICESG